MDRQTAKYYSENAAELRALYGSGSTGLPDGLARSLEGYTKVLDVGCGAGHDLSRLLEAGKDAYGVDAVPEMVAQAKLTLESSGVDATGRLFVSELPDLKPFADGEFDAVVCSAVLMHLDPERLFDAVFTLRRILKPGGKLLVSVPEDRPDVDPKSRRDIRGRLFSELPPARLQLLLERIGFEMAASHREPDSLGRKGYLWWSGEFRRTDASERPLHLVEGILNRDKKDSTYKLALFRALSEIAQTQAHLAVHLTKGKVKIPLAAIAERWLLYYWPVFESTVFIPQRTNETAGGIRQLAIRKPLGALIQHYANARGMSGFYCDWKSGCLSGEARRLFRHARRELQSTIHEMPARYAGGGCYDVFQYDAADKTLLMDVALWRELCLMGSWIADATLLRWAEQTELFAKQTVKASQVIDCLLRSPDQGRNVADAKRHFASLPSRECVWSRRKLTQARFDVDHAMPFSYWRNNDLWNLFPVDPHVNSDKRDKLPTYRQLQSSRDAILDIWRGLDRAMGERFMLEAQTLLGRSPIRRANWEGQLFSRFVEAFEVTATQRRAERWEAPSPSAAGVPRELAHATKRPRQTRLAAPLLTEPPTPSTPPTVPEIIPFHEVKDGAFRTHLPVLGSLAAGEPFHGIETGSLDDLHDVDWIEVPPETAKAKRFVVRVAGASMEPTFHVGDLLVFEYHRTPRQDHQVVIANLADLGSDAPGIEAIKRVSQTAEEWVFRSDNPDFQPIRRAKSELAHPIVGTLVSRLCHGA